MVEEEEDLIEEEDDDESSRQAGGGAKRGAAERGADGGSAEARKRARGKVAEEPAEGDWEEELNSEDDMDGACAKAMAAHLHLTPRTRRMIWRGCVLALKLWLPRVLR